MAAVGNPFRFNGNCDVRLANVLLAQDDSCYSKVCKSHAMIIIQQCGTNIFGYFHIGDVRVKHDGVQAFVGNETGAFHMIKMSKGAEKKHLRIESTTPWFNVPVAQVNTMIDAIYAQKLVVEGSQGQPPQPVLYQTAGDQRLAILGGNGGHSCITWATEKLALAQLKLLPAATNSTKTVPAIATRPMLTQMINATAALALIGIALLIKKKM